MEADEGQGGLGGGLHPVVRRVTEAVQHRSASSRRAYLARIDAVDMMKPRRGGLACCNLAHGFAGFEASDKAKLKASIEPALGIVSAYNDMLSAHQPLQRFPDLIRQAAHEVGGVAQFAGGVPAMCDGITQGQVGMELSLFSRDVIAMATAVALSHDMFDAAVLLGVCDKIVPGLVIGALSFGHLPVVLVPAGPMPSGLPNGEKNRTRQLYAEGKLDKSALLEAEAASYHSPGTCTFYGTANSNQMLMEVMGLHLPGASFVPPGTPLRDALTREAARRALALTGLGPDYTPIGQLLDERAFVNGVVGLLATGGSTNHTLHLVAMAAAAGIQLSWDDFAALSDVVPLLTRIYPNGSEDVNAFQAAGGMAYLIRELLRAGLLHEDVQTVAGPGLSRYTQVPEWVEGPADRTHQTAVRWLPGPTQSRDLAVLRPFDAPFSPDGGLRVLSGNLGRAVIKVSAVKPDRQVVEAPARVFESQDEMLQAFQQGQLERDGVVVVRFQGPKANGMPELHQLTPSLGVLQDRGFRVALVTDGRMSGASGKVPAAIHVTPEAADGGWLARVQDGDLIRLDAARGQLQVLVPDAELLARTPARPSLTGNRWGMGRELFESFRQNVTGAESGARSFGFRLDDPTVSHESS